MNPFSRLHRFAARCCTVTLLATALAAQVAPNLSAITEVHPREIVVGIKATGAPHSPVLVALSAHPLLEMPVRTPFGELRIRSVDALLRLQTDAQGRAELRVALPRPLNPFAIGMQALVAARLTNALLLAAGGGTRAAAVDIALDDKGQMTTMTVRAEGKPKDQVCVVFKDKAGKEVPPKICGTIGTDGSLPGGSMSVPIPATATTFTVTVGGDAVAGGVLR